VDVVNMLLGEPVEASIPRPETPRESAPTDEKSCFAGAMNKVRALQAIKGAQQSPSCITAELQIPKEKGYSIEELSLNKVVDDYDNTPLTAACKKVHGWGPNCLSVQMVTILLDHGCPINRQNPHSGMTALHWASHHGHYALTELLLSRGADPSLLSHTNDKLAIDLAGIKYEAMKPKRMRLQKLLDAAAIGGVGSSHWFKDEKRAKVLSTTNQEFMRAEHLRVITMIVEAKLTGKGYYQAGYEGEIVVPTSSADDAKTQHRAESSRMMESVVFWSASVGLHEQFKALVSVEEEAHTNTCNPLKDYAGDELKSSPLHECARQGWPTLLQQLLVQSQRFHKGRLTDLGAWLGHDKEGPLHIAAKYKNVDTLHVLMKWCRENEDLTDELSRRSSCGAMPRDYFNPKTDLEMRKLLSIGEEKSNFEYVLVFDNSKFEMKSIKSILNTKNNKGPAMLTKRQPLTNINKHTDGKLEILLISANASTIEDEATKMSLKVKLRVSQRYEPYDVDNPHLFEPLRSKDENKVILNMMKKQVDVDSLVHEGTVDELFPLHRASGQRELYEMWCYNPRQVPGNLCEKYCTKIFSPARKFSPAQFIGDLLHEDRDNNFAELTACYNYLGATHALYFAWVSFYALSLLMLAPFSVALIIHQAVNGGVSNEVSSGPYYMVIVMLWITFINEGWKRKRSELVARWNLGVADGAQPARPEYRGDWVISNISGGVERYFNANWRQRRVIQAVLVMVVMLVAVVSAFWFVRILKTADGIESSQIAVQALGIINGIFIAVMNIVYQKLAHVFTAWENHRTQAEHDDAYIMKTFAFQAVNSWGPMCITAYADEQSLLISLIISSAITLQISDFATLFVLPWIQYKMALKMNGLEDQTLLPQENSQETATDQKVNPESPEDKRKQTKDGAAAELHNYEMQFCMQPPPALTEIFCSKVLMLGFMVLFAQVSPVIVVFSACFLFFSIRLEMMAFAYCFRRPRAMTAANIGIWLDILQALSFLAVTNNCIYLYFSTTELDRYVSGDKAKLLLIFVIEHALLYMKASIKGVIEDEPEYVMMQRLFDATRHQEEIKERKKLIKQQAKALKAALSRSNSDI